MKIIASKRLEADAASSLSETYKSLMFFLSKFENEDNEQND